MPSSPSAPVQFVVRGITIALVVIILAACGTSDDETPALPTEDVRSEATASTGGSTVQTLTDRINTAWADVTSLRVTSASGPIPTETDSDNPVPRESYTIEEWTAPNDRRIAEVVNGEIVNEQVFVDGDIYMRGVFVGAAVAPEVGSETWVTLDPEVIPPDTPVGNRVAYLTREPGSPFTRMAPDLLTEPVNESGNVKVEDRTCALYTFGDPDNTGEEIRYEIALDENDLPCQVIQRGGGFQNSSVYEINADDIQIISPDSGTQVSGTPEG